MANIEDYLNWRGDLPLSLDPFGEVDNLILSQLAYVDFDGVVSPDIKDCLPVKEAARLYFERHTMEELKARKTFISSAPFLLQQAAQTRRFGDLKLSGYVNLLDEKAEAQLSAITFHLPDGAAYVAFRGTDDTLVGWKEDFNLSFLDATEGQRQAARYLNENFAGAGIPLRVGGHSKGGNFAVYASAYADAGIRGFIQTVYTNDGPGLKEDLTAAEGYQEILPRIVSTVPEDSVIGLLLSSEAKNHVVKSSAAGILQHDAMTWQVLGRNFVETKERSAFSQFFEKTLRKWISGLEEKERAAFTESLFGLLTAGGVSTLTDMKNSRTFLMDVIKKAASMPKEERQEFQTILTQLLQIGTDTALAEIKKVPEERQKAALGEA